MQFEKTLQFDKGNTCMKKGGDLFDVARELKMV